ncbi:MAG TPA: ribonuclease III [Chloroflexota bacterium]|nr:ribonuclease III [Chloroflexota bacterium]
MKPTASLDELEARLGYVFNDRALLERALVHRSLVNESDLQATDSNERLEFLGDAALQLAATTYLYRSYPDRLEGELSAARAALVNLQALARRAETVDLTEFVSTGAGVILHSGRSRAGVIGRSYEAVIGAVLVDGGLPAVDRFLRPWFDEFFRDYEFTPNALNSKTRLQNVTQGAGGPPPTYHCIESTGPKHAPKFRVEVAADGKTLAVGEGTSLQRAELDAAGRALAMLDCDSLDNNEPVSG